MADTSSKQQWVEVGIRLFGVYLCAHSVIAAINGLYTAIFGGVNFFGHLFREVVVGAGSGLLVGGILAFCGGMIVETIMGPDTPKAP